MYPRINKTVKIIFTGGLTLAFFLSGFPSVLFFEKAIDKMAERNIVDTLYLSSKSSNVIDRDLGDIFKPRVEKVYAADFQMQTGYYMGTGASQAITGVGFQPQFILIKSNTTAGVGVFKTSAMAAADTAFFSATAHNTASQLSLDSDGFTLGTLANLNTANVRYQWTAFYGSDCTSSGTFCVGQYTGNGAGTRTITTGFQPDLVIVKRSTAVAGNFRVTSHPENRASYFETTADNTAGGLIASFASDGFVVGSAVNNVNGGTYEYIAFKASSGVFAEGTYTGNATDNRNITGVGFRPDFLFVKNSTSGTANNRSPAMTQNESYGDHATAMGVSTASTVDLLQELQSDGFQVGASARANESGATFYYAAFAGAPAYPSSGTFVMESGTYTGTGSGFSITGLPFAPDLVIIKDNSTQQSVFRTRLMRGDITAYLGAATADFATGITSLNSDGFSIGVSTVVNTTSNTYQWQAFGNAFNPYTNSGADDFAIGVYTGNGIDNRDITRLPWQPNFVTTKRNSTSAGVLRTSTQTGDLSVALSATAEAANQIQALNTDGFQLGTTNVNTSGSLHRWFAFKNGDNFTVGGYTGNATDNRNITGVGFQPDLVWIKRSTAVNGVMRPSTLTGDATQYFVATANVADRIQTFINDGFQIGGNQTETNTSGGTYRYAAWHGKKYTQQAYRLFANANSTDVGATLASQNTSATLSSTGEAFRLRILLRVDNGNLFLDGQNFKLQFATKSGTCDTGFSGESYADVTGATAIAYSTANSPADGDNLTANANDPTDGGRTIVNQDYEEANNFTNTVAAIPSGQDGKWDFSLIDNSAPAETSYCFRVVKSNGSLLDTYTVIPEIITAAEGGEDPTLTFSISDNLIGFGTLSASAARYATGDTNGSASETVAHTITASTNGTNGYVITVQGATLTSGSDTINAIGGTSAASSPGSEQFGLRITASGGNGSVTSPYNHAFNYAYAANASTANEVASDPDGDDVSTTYSVRYLGNISGVTEAGSYTATLTYVITAGF